MTVEVKDLKEGDEIDLIDGSTTKVNHVFIKDEKGYILTDNYRWYVYFKDEDVDVLRKS